MPSNVENLAAIRQRLGGPNPHQPTDPQLLNIYIDHIANHCAQLQNTRSHWSIGHCPLEVSPGTEDYEITVGDFGRPFLVYTTDATDTHHVRCEIPFSLLQDADQRYQGPQQVDSQGHSAVQICFFREGPSSPVWKARPVPIPGASATYEIFYEASYKFGSLGDSPGLDLFHHLVRVQTALSALPLCAWGDISIKQNPKAWQLQMQTFRDSLLHDEIVFQKQFDSFRAQSTREGVSRKRGEGWSYVDDYGGAGAMHDPTYI